MAANLLIREAHESEFEILGQLLVEVYSSLDGFPTPAEQPGYYQMLANIGDFTRKKDAKVLVALSPDGGIIGGVVYFGDMAEYGAGGTAATLTNTSGIRLLGVSLKARGMGVGKALTRACIDRARQKGHAEVVLHTTQPMQTAWRMYERLGFGRSVDLDFMQGQLPIYGFRLRLKQPD